LSEISLVTVDNVSLCLPGVALPVLRDIAWRIERGRHCALTGGNGAGKSTLLRLLRGDVWPATGTVCWHTEEGAETSRLAGRTMTALVSPAQQEQYQRQAWDITGRELLLTAFDDTPLLSPQSCRRSAKSAQHATVEEMAARLRGVPLLERRLSTFSQGQLRLLLLGRALLRKPPLLLLDECAEGLDAANARRFFTALEDCSTSCTVVMTTHRQKGIPTWCARRLHINKGRLSEQAAPAHALPRDRRQQPLPPSPPARQPAAGALFALEHVTVFVNRKKVLRDICWSMHEGENWQITGANGSGKSTLLRLLAGDEFAADGGKFTRAFPNTLADIRKRVRLVSDLSQTLYAYPLNALELVCSGFDNTVGIYREYTARERAQALQTMDVLCCAALAERSIRLLSTGQIRRLFLARALVGAPRVLLLDEPCAGLDRAGRERYLDMLDELADRGIQLVFVSHHKEDAPLCINRRARMKNGRLTDDSDSARARPQ
jgi:molybdate transport system ATP-binding protein